MSAKCCKRNESKSKLDQRRKNGEHHRNWNQVNSLTSEWKIVSAVGAVSQKKKHQAENNRGENQPPESFRGERDRRLHCIVQLGRSVATKTPANSGTRAENHPHHANVNWISKHREPPNCTANAFFPLWNFSFLFLSRTDPFPWNLQFQLRINRWLIVHKIENDLLFRVTRFILIGFNSTENSNEIERNEETPNTICLFGKAICIVYANVGKTTVQRV